MYIGNSVKTSTREKARAKNAVINYVYEYCKEMVEAVNKAADAL